MSRTLARKDCAAVATALFPGASDDVPRTGFARWPARSRWHDFDDDDPHDRPMDGEEYEDFRWEEIPDDRQVFLPDELWDEDEWD